MLLHSKILLEAAEFPAHPSSYTAKLLNPQQTEHFHSRFDIPVPEL